MFPEILANILVLLLVAEGDEEKLQKLDHHAEELVVELEVELVVELEVGGFAEGLDDVVDGFFYEVFYFFVLLVYFRV